MDFEDFEANEVLASGRTESRHENLVTSASPALAPGPDWTRSRPREPKRDHRSYILNSLKRQQLKGPLGVSI